MARREFVQLAQHLDFEKHNVAGATWSPKLDGMRGFWDGGITQGMKVADVPWANVERDKKDKISTGLWSRLGKPINGHPEWLAGLPRNLCLDGELYLGKESLEDTMAVKCEVPDKEVWDEVTFQIFDTPSRAFFQDGDIVYDPHTRKYVDFLNFCPANCVSPMLPFEGRQEWLNEQLSESQVGSQVQLVFQQQLSLVEADARKQLQDAFDQYVAEKGEGLMVRLAGRDVWVPQRVGTLLKYKPEHETTGTITGYYAAEIGKTGKLLGRMGSIEVQWNGAVFTLSGFKDAERLLDGKIDGRHAVDWAMQYPGKRMPAGYSLSTFPIGASIPFKYTSCTTAGVPREARYDRDNN